MVRFQVTFRSPGRGESAGVPPGGETRKRNAALHLDSTGLGDPDFFDDCLDDIIRGFVFRFGLVGNGQAVTQYVQGDVLDVLGD